MNNLVKFLLLTALYFITGKLGLLMAVPPGYATAVWPPSGFAFAGLFIFGYRFWPAIWLGSFLVNIGTSLDASSFTAIIHSALPALIIAFGAAMQALAGAGLVRHFVGYPLMLEKEADVFKFMLLSGPFSCLIGASIGIATLVTTGVVKQNSALFSWWTWWVGDCIGVLIFAPLLLMFFAEPKDIWRSRLKSVALPMLSVFVVIVCVFIFMKNSQEKRIQSDFGHESMERSIALENHLESYFQDLYAIEAFYKSSNSVDRSEFKTFVGYALNSHKGLMALEWCQRVTREERLNFEAAVKQEGYSDFEIKQFIDQNRSAEKDEYFPITYIEPFEGVNLKAVGFDFNSEDLRKQALQKAVQTGKVTLTAPLSLIQNPTSTSGFVAFLPIYKNGSVQNMPQVLQDNVAGVVTGIFDIEQIIDDAFEHIKDRNFFVFINDEDPKRGLLPIFSENFGTDKLVPWDIKIDQKIKDIGWVRTIEVGGRQWKITFYPTVDYIISRQNWSVWFILAGGLLFIGLLGGFLLVITGRENLVRRLVDERTVDLNKANDKLKQGIERQAMLTQEAQEAQLKALEAEERFRMMVEGVKDYAIYLLDPKGTVVTWNLGAERIKGYKSYEIVGKNFSMFFCEEDKSSGKPERILQIAVEEGVYNGICLRIRKDGSTFWARVLITVLKDKMGNLRGFSKITRDITEEKKNKEEVERLSAYQKAILDNAGFAIITGDTQGNIKTFNPAAERMLGYKEQEMVDKLTPAVFHDKNEVVQRAEEFSKELNQQVIPGFDVFVVKARLGLPNVHEWIYVRKDGSKFPVLLSVTALKDGLGKIYGYLGLATDISDLKNSQALLAAKSHELEKANQALVKLNSELQKLDQLKSDFVSTVSHEIRTPLAISMEGINLVLDGLAGTVSDMQRQLLSDSQENLQRLNRIINDLLDISKIEAGKIELSLNDVEVVKLVKEVVDSYQMIVSQKSILLSSHLPQTPIRILVDQDKIIQILNNLLNNAFKFCPEKGTIDVELTENPSEVILSVKDTGIGIAQENISKLFTKFQQFARQEGAGIKGTGLGLVICKSLVELHGGRIWVKSQLGQGTQFNISLPKERNKGDANV